jgi:hypothetical protein
MRSLSPGKNDSLLGAATEGDTSEQDGGVIKYFNEGAIIHESGSGCGY